MLKFEISITKISVLNTEAQSETRQSNFLLPYPCHESDRVELLLATFCCIFLQVLKISRKKLPGSSINSSRTNCAEHCSRVSFDLSVFANASSKCIIDLRSLFIRKVLSVRRIRLYALSSKLNWGQTQGIKLEKILWKPFEIFCLILYSKSLPVCSLSISMIKSNLVTMFRCKLSYLKISGFSGWNYQALRSS